MRVGAISSAMFAVGLAATVLGAGAALAVPALTVSPPAIHPKGGISISGTGFGVSEAVDIYLDTTDEILEFTDGSGAFGPDKLTIPKSTLPGSHWITALGRKDGDGAHKALTITTAWAEHGFTERGHRVNPYENVIDASNVASLEIAWQYHTGGAVYSAPAYNNGVVYAGSTDGKLYALTSAGTLKWSATTGGSIGSSPAYASGIVYVGSNDGKLYAFKATNGAAAWAAPATTGGPVFSSPAVAGGLVFAGSNDGKLYAFHAANGAPAWTSIATGFAIRSSPAVANGVVYVGSDNHNLYAFKVADGTAVWATVGSTGNKIESSPAVANGIVYVGSEDGKFYAFSAIDGSAVFPASASLGISDSSPAVANGVVYQAGTGAIYEFDAQTGAQVGSLSVGNANIDFSSPAIANGILYIGTYDQNLYAFDARPCGLDAVCSPLWSAHTGNVIESPPTVADGMVFVGSQDQNIYAFALDGGTPVAYRHNGLPPRYETLHPDLRLKPVRSAKAART